MTTPDDTTGKRANDMSKPEIEHTDRGFALSHFTDFNGVKCSIQKSSLATEDCIWLGADEIGLKHFRAYQGWEDVPTPHTMEDHFIANNRMHLSRARVAELLPALQRFVDTGEIEPPHDRS